MGICESLLKRKEPKKTITSKKGIYPPKPVDDFKYDEKSNDTMDYVKIPLNQSYNSEMIKKKFEDNSTNDTNNQREKIIKKKYEQKNDLNTTDNNFTKSNISSNYQEETTPTVNPLLNSDNNNKINKKNDYVKTSNIGNSFIYNSSRTNTNSNSSGVYSSNNQNNRIKNSNKINVSIHESRVSQSAYISIPKQDERPLSISNNFSESLFQSQ